MIDYLFYFIQEKYKQWGEVDVPKVYALTIISTLQLFNVITILVTALILNLIKVEVISNVNLVIATVVILLVNYFYLFQIKGSDTIIT